MLKSGLLLIFNVKTYKQIISSAFQDFKKVHNIFQF